MVTGYRLFFCSLSLWFSAVHTPHGNYIQTFVLSSVNNDAPTIPSESSPHRKVTEDQIRQGSSNTYLHSSLNENHKSFQLLFLKTGLIKDFHIERNTDLTDWQWNRYQGEAHDSRTTEIHSTLILIHRDPHGWPLKILQNFAKISNLFSKIIQRIPVNVRLRDT